MFEYDDTSYDVGVDSDAILKDKEKMARNAKAKAMDRARKSLNKSARSKGLLKDKYQSIRSKARCSNHMLRGVCSEGTDEGYGLDNKRKHRCVCNGKHEFKDCPKRIWRD